MDSSRPAMQVSGFPTSSLRTGSFRMALRQILQTGKQLLAPANNFGQWYLATAKKHPFPTAFFTSGIKTSAADLIAQKVSRKPLVCTWEALLACFHLCISACLYMHCYMAAECFIMSYAGG